MYSGITQTQMAEALFLSQSQYNRKENGQAAITLRDARKIARKLDLNEKIIDKFWMADNIYALMKVDKDLFYDAMKIVELHFENYETFIEIPNKNCSYSTIDDVLKHKNKK